MSGLAGRSPGNAAMFFFGSKTSSKVALEERCRGFVEDRGHRRWRVSFSRSCFCSEGILEDAIEYLSSSMGCRTLQETRELAADLDINDIVEVEMSGYRLCASGILLHEANRKARPLAFRRTRQATVPKTLLDRMTRSKCPDPLLPVTRRFTGPSSCYLSSCQHSIKGSVPMRLGRSSSPFHVAYPTILAQRIQ